jgi:AcrR family transcriptional regulator
MQSRKQHLIDTAYRLFNQFGYHATGIDRILAESGVSKATLYKYFRSKDELILTVLEQRHMQLMQHMKEKMAEALEQGEDIMLVMFDILDEWFHTGEFFGCNFIHASAEFAQENERIQLLAASHKNAVYRLILDSLTTDNKKADAKLAAQLLLLMDGAIVQAHTRGDRNAARLAREMAAELLHKQ